MGEFGARVCGYTTFMSIVSDVDPASCEAIMDLEDRFRCGVFKVKGVRSVPRSTRQRKLLDKSLEDVRKVFWTAHEHDQPVVMWSVRFL